MSLVGCVVIDNACVGTLRGKIISVTESGEVFAMFRPGSFCALKRSDIESGRYSVEIPDTNERKTA